MSSRSGRGAPHINPSQPIDQELSTADVLAEVLSASADGLTERQLADALGNRLPPRAVRAVLIADPVRFRKLPGRTLKFWRLKWKAVKPTDQGPSIPTATNELHSDGNPLAAVPLASPELIDEAVERQGPSTDEVRPADEVDRYRSELAKAGVGTTVKGPSALRHSIIPDHPILLLSDKTLDTLAGMVEPYIDTD